MYTNLGLSNTFNYTDEICRQGMVRHQSDETNNVEFIDLGQFHEIS